VKLAAIKGHRSHPQWFAYALHRVSGLALALFLPVHFWTLSMALTDPEALDGFLTFAELPLVKLAEFGLVFLLAVHLFGGLRLMAMEWLPWSGGRKTMAAAAVAASFGVSAAFLLKAI
jgi:fumarate reductase subunit D